MYSSDPGYSVIVGLSVTDSRDPGQSVTDSTVVILVNPLQIVVNLVNLLKIIVIMGNLLQI
jgi:hypothetical protein